MTEDNTLVKGIDSEFVGHGLVFGKFMPPTNGHLFLLNFARESCRKLTILVCSLPDEPIPGEVRYKWIKELYPDCNVIHHAVEIPQEPSEHPDFFNIWKESIYRHCPGEKFDAMFASEPYGYKMAAIMNMRFIPVNVRRDLVPISGTDMRNDPMKHWEHLHPVVRPYFAKRIAVIGPKKSGKTQLASGLAKHFGTVLVGDYAKILQDDFKANLPAFKKSDMSLLDVSTIVRGQLSSERALARQSNKLLFSDTEVLTSMYHSKKKFGEVPEWVENIANERKYHLYLLITPGEDAKKSQIDAYKWFQLELIRRELPFIEVSGGSEKKLLQTSIKVVEKLL